MVLVLCRIMKIFICACLLLFALFGIGFDTESTEPFFRTGSRVMD
jgi:hypothetical protein